MHVNCILEIKVQIFKYYFKLLTHIQFVKFQVDRAMSEELRSTGSFEVMSLDTDEAEHSIEMHLPYIAKMMAPKKNEFTVVPILVGSISADKEAKYGAIFAKYLADPTNLFVISSDFCHWGDRFHYTYYDQSKGEIHQSIKALDFAVSFFSASFRCTHYGL